jgi:uncharacterized protein YecT (DUF1311 family)
MPATAAKADIISACYTDCAAETDSNVELKACLSRAANKADRLLNRGYQALQEAIRKSAKEMEQPPDPQLKALTDAQKQWIDFRDANCAFEDALAFGGTAPAAIIPPASARSPMNGSTISTASGSRSSANRFAEARPRALEWPQKARILPAETHDWFDQEWAVARSFLLGSAPSARHESQGLIA